MRNSGSVVNERFELSALEMQTPLWRSVTDHLEARLAALRTQNDGDKGEVETATLRGRIAELKALLALNTPLQHTN